MNTNKIVIVDDDMDVITIIQAILKGEGFEVLYANDKIEGLKLIREVKPKVAILDVMMSTIYEGFELAQEILQDPELSKIGILMQTSIDILTTTKPDVQAMAREFRKSPGFKDLHVILVRDINTGKAGVDYLAEDGKSVFFHVDGFIRKPVEAKKVIPEVKRIMAIH